MDTKQSPTNLGLKLTFAQHNSLQCYMYMYIVFLEIQYALLYS